MHPHPTYPQRLITGLASCGFVIASLLTAEAQTESSFQDGVRPFGLSVTGPVMTAGSDASSADFQANALPSLMNFVNTNLSERQSLTDIAGVSLDPNSLRLQSESSVRVYFISEGYRNTLGYNVDNLATGTTSETSLIFPDASSYNQYYSDPEGALEANPNLRNNNTPIIPGDFVDLGVYDANSQINFLLTANGANGGQYTYGADDNANPDLMQHMVAFALEGSPYLLIGFEDLYGGGDMDYNDIVFAVDIGETNVNYLANPEPAFLLMAFIPLLAGFWLYRNSPEFREAF